MRRVISWPRVIQEEDRASDSADPWLCPITGGDILFCESSIHIMPGHLAVSQTSRLDYCGQLLSVSVRGRGEALLVDCAYTHTHTHTHTPTPMDR